MSGKRIMEGLADALTAVKGNGGRVDLTIYKVRGDKVRAAVTNTKTGKTRIVRMIDPDKVREKPPARRKPKLSLVSSGETKP